MSTGTRVIKTVLCYGPLHRLWPATDQNGNLYVSVSATRSFARPLCRLLKSEDLGNSWIELANFHSMDPRNTTTGRPFISKEGSIMIAVWDAGFYEFGRTWLSIYRSDDGQSWESVYENPDATYGNHFFESDCDGEIYLCAGAGGGGSKGKVRYAPAKGLLLRSQDFGRHWEPCLEVEGPTALYDGTALGETLLVSARERGSIFRKEGKEEAWSEVHLGQAARNLARIGQRVVVSSDSAIFVTSDRGHTWIKRTAPVRNVVLRYPTLFRDRVITAGVGWRSLVLAIDLDQNKWTVPLDITEIAHTRFMSRLAITPAHLFLGDEGETGSLLRVPTDSLEHGLTFVYSIMSLLTWKDASKVFEGIEKEWRSRLVAVSQ